MTDPKLIEAARAEFERFILDSLEWQQFHLDMNGLHELSAIQQCRIIAPWAAAFAASQTLATRKALKVAINSINGLLDFYENTDHAENPCGSCIICIAYKALDESEAALGAAAPEQAPSFPRPVTQAACAISQLSNKRFAMKQSISIQDAEDILVKYRLNTHTELVKALEAIRDGETRCECDHSTDDCCNKVGEFCPFCIAAAALKAAGR